MRAAATLFFVSILGLAGARSKEVAASTRLGALKQTRTKKSLVALMRAVKQAQTRGNSSHAASLTRGLLLDEARIRKALRKNVDAGVVARILALHKRFSALPAARLAGLLSSRPGQTEIKAHGATTEEIAQNRPGTVVYRRFPGGAVKAAKTILRPRMKFYEVEYVVPGQKSGMKYHLFFWDGKAWGMLGPVWRALR